MGLPKYDNITPTKLYAKAAGGRGSLPLLKNLERQARRGGYILPPSPLSPPIKGRGYEE